jgi:hypothetical protein
MGRGHQCAAASGVRDEGRPLAISLQERAANHRKRRRTKARVVLIADNRGNLYGTTVDGGTSRNCGNSGCGTVFRLTGTGFVP